MVMPGIADDEPATVLPGATVVTDSLELPQAAVTRAAAAHGTSQRACLVKTSTSPPEIGSDEAPLG